MRLNSVFGGRMDRREFGRLVAGAALAPAWVSASAQGVGVKGIRFSFMLWALEKQASFDRCVEIVAEAGYQGIELTGEFQSWSPEQRARIMTRMRSLGMVFDAMSGVKAGFAVPGQREEFRTQFVDHLRAAKELECPTVILLSGVRVDGIGAQVQRQTAIDNLKWAAERATKEQIEVVIEPIDLLENPTIYMATVTDGFEIARAVNRPNVKVLYDFYHEQRSFGNLIEKLEKNIDLVGLVHVADVPGRHEPGTGEIDYGAIYRKLSALGYNHWVAMEYYPTGEPIESLKRARVEAQREFGH
ncbi:hydroxypyruvate isomerase family protein [Granulicella sp. L60]|uniref:hydroxypyruvate isomerase family protein n=1 Tax=Granulicella sp. L60 TaxID=1641866 RepID=UPI0020B12DAD|nr:TIM barrel protein [Granulicella sp. L60]